MKDAFGTLSAKRLLLLDELRPGQPTSGRGSGEVAKRAEYWG